MTAAATEENVRKEVRALLARSAAFRSLPPEQQQKLAADMEKVSGFLAKDSSWLAAPRAAALEEKKPDAVDALKQRLATGPEQVGKGFVAGAIREGTAAFTDLVQKVDFAKFVGGLVHNVFQAVVDASIQQMQAYGELLAATAKTVDQFASENISDAQARDHIASRFPDAVDVDTSGDVARLRPKEDAASVDVGAAFGVEGADLSDPEGEQKVIAAARLQLASQRQHLLATMVLLGINRIVVTDGHINAKVVFDMRATDSATAQNKAQMNDEQKTHAQSSSGWLTNLVGGYDVGTSHETTVGSAVDERSDSRAQLKAQLSGDVRLAFKSETFPLERMVDVIGMQDLQHKAAPPATVAPARPAPAAAPAPGGAR